MTSSAKCLLPEECRSIRCPSSRLWVRVLVWSAGIMQRTNSVELRHKTRSLRSDSSARRARAGDGTGGGHCLNGTNERMNWTPFELDSQPPVRGFVHRPHDLSGDGL